MVVNTTPWALIANSASHSITVIQLEIFKILKCVDVSTNSILYQKSTQVKIYSFLAVKYE